MANYINKFKTHEEFVEKQYKLDYPAVNLIETDDVIEWPTEYSRAKIYVQTPNGDNGIAWDDNDTTLNRDSWTNMGFDYQTQIVSGIIDSGITGALTTLDNFSHTNYYKLLTAEEYPYITELSYYIRLSSDIYSKFTNVTTLYNESIVSDYDHIPSSVTHLYSTDPLYVRRSNEEMLKAAHEINLPSQIEYIGGSPFTSRLILNSHAQLEDSPSNYNYSYIYVNDEWVDEYRTNYPNLANFIAGKSDMTDDVLLKVKLSGDSTYYEIYTYPDCCEPYNNRAMIPDAYYAEIEIDNNKSLINFERIIGITASSRNEPSSRQPYQIDKIIIGDNNQNNYIQLSRYDYYTYWVLVREIVFKGSTEYFNQENEAYRGYNVFAWWLYSLEKITILSAQERINLGGFYNCRFISEVDLPQSGVTYFEGLQGCGRLNESFSAITLPDTIRELGNYALYDNPYLRTVNGLNNVEVLGYNAIKGTAWYDNLPNGLNYIGKVAYCYKGEMPQDTAIVINDGTKALQADLFRYRTSLSSIDIPSGVTYIGDYAFDGCSSLQSVTVRAITPPTLGSYTFNNANNCPIYVPAESVEAYKSTIAWSNYASRIQAIPSTT